MAHDLSRFFPGDQEYHRFELELHKGKARLACVVRHRWEKILFCTLNCGNTREHNVKRRVGFSQSDRLELEAAAKTSLGLENVAKLGAAITEKTATELQFEQSVEVEDKFQFTAPKCGRLTVVLYQLARIYDLRYDDKRFFHRDHWETSVTEWLERYFDGTSRTENDPACGCHPEPVTGGDGLGVLKLNGFAMIVAYTRSDKGLAIPVLKTGSEVTDLIEPVLVRVKTANLPAYLRFVVGELPAETEAILEPEGPRVLVLDVGLGETLLAEVHALVASLERMRASRQGAKEVLSGRGAAKGTARRTTVKSRR